MSPGCRAWGTDPGAALSSHLSAIPGARGIPGSRGERIPKRPLEMHPHLPIPEREEATGWHWLVLEVNCSGRQLPLKAFFQTVSNTFCLYLSLFSGLLRR